MARRLAIIADKGKRVKTVTGHAGKRLRERALTVAEDRAQAEQAKAQEKLAWFLELGANTVTK